MKRPIGPMTDLSLESNNVVTAGSHHDIVVAAIKFGVGIGVPAENTFAYKPVIARGPWVIVKRNLSTKLGSAIASAGDYDGDGKVDYAVGEELFTSQMLYGRVLVDLTDQGAEETIVNETPGIRGFGHSIAPAIKE